MKPTPELYASLEEAYEFFNHRLFESGLPTVIFTVQRQNGVMGYFAPERWGNLHGNKCHEIAINPSYIANSCLIEVLQTLVHEMVHCWQYCHGTPAKGHYHNREWAQKMIEVGLMPSSTGVPGGARTGQVMSDYIVKGGKFARIFEEMKKHNNFQLKWIDRFAAERVFDPAFHDTSINIQAEGVTTVLTPSVKVQNSDPSQNQQLNVRNEIRYSALLPKEFILEKPVRHKKSKSKYRCPGCLTHVWGRPGLNLLCGDCSQPYEEA